VPWRLAYIGIWWVAPNSQLDMARKVPSASSSLTIWSKCVNLIRTYLEEEREFRVCGEAIDGFDVIDKAQNLKPDLIILDGGAK
jgi:hypothetical protein